MYLYSMVSMYLYCFVHIGRKKPLRAKSEFMKIMWPLFWILHWCLNFLINIFFKKSIDLKRLVINKHICIYTYTMGLIWTTYSKCFILCVDSISEHLYGCRCATLNIVFVSMCNIEKGFAYDYGIRHITGVQGHQIRAGSVIICPLLPCTHSIFL